MAVLGSHYKSQSKSSNCFETWQTNPKIYTLCIRTKLWNITGKNNPTLSILLYVILDHMDL